MDKNGDVDLGFVASVPEWKLRSKYFPCKVGGKPAWLNLSDLPSTDDLLCSLCNQPMIHLLQVYAPDNDVDTCFHRTIFVFVCKNVDCCQPNSAENFKVFRSQLPRTNSFYSYEPPKDLDDEDDEDAPQPSEDDDHGPSASDYLKLCNLCGCRGPKRCSQCQTSYCSVLHQRVDWKLGHKKKCRGIDTGESSGEDKPSYTLPEYEILIETEDYKEPDEDTETQERTDEERMKEFEKLEKGTPSVSKKDLEDLESMAKSTTDKRFLLYQERIKCEPEQVLRYQKGGIPLCISDDNIHSADVVPPCQCGANRQFEFQVMSQLLIYLELDELEKSIDWGTLLIYTCSQDCDLDNKGYHKEFIIKQDFSSEKS